MIGVGMMPGTIPATRLVVATRGPAHAAAFIAGYVVTWLGVGLAGFLLLSPLAPAVRSADAGAALVATAVYEVSPLKEACLRRCRSPLRVLLQSSFAGGMRQGLDCAGCCAFLMLLMVALGLMSVAWIALLAAVVFVQKAAPFGGRSAPALAVALGAGAVATWI